MSIRIDPAKCTGCKRCLGVCPGSLIYENEAGRAYMKYPRDCWGCTACLKECRYGAIGYYLGADIGGRGSILQVREEGEQMHWQVTGPAGQQREITLDKREANQY